MVSVSTYHPLKQVHMLTVDSCETVFLDDKNSQSVADVQQSRCHRVVARTVGVAAELLELHQSPFLKAIRDAGSYSCVVLVHVYTLQLDHLSIEEEASVVVEFNMSDAGYGLIRVYESVACINLSHQCVQIRILAAPEVWILHRNDCQSLVVVLCKDHRALSGTFACNLSVSILEDVLQ